MRIRTIKPEFWSSPDMADLPFFDRLLFIGLWSIADDWGRLQADPRYIRGELFSLDTPVDRDGVQEPNSDPAKLPAGSAQYSAGSASISDGLERLRRGGQITIYRVGNSRRYCQVVNFVEYQKIDKRSKERIPSPTRDDVVLLDAWGCPLDSDPAKLPAGSASFRALEREREKEREKEPTSSLRSSVGGQRGGADSEHPLVPAPVDDAAAVASAAPPTGNQLEVRGGGTPTRGGHRYTDEFEKFWKTYPRKVGKAEAAKAFTKLLKGGQVDADQLTAAAQAHAQAWQQSGTSQEFIPHASTWLNKGRWSDEPEVLNRTGDGRPIAGLSDDQWQQAWERAQILDADDDTQSSSPGWP